jgi:alanine racemase
MLDLDGAALVANWRWLSEQAGHACGAAIKADGYGLGACAVLDQLVAAGARDFYVSSWAEVAPLGKTADGVGVAVLHGVREADLPVALTSPARPILNSAEQVVRWREAGGGACDVMVDTGMNRLGLRPEEATSGLLDGLRIDTLMSHLACADDPDHPLNGQQLNRFQEVAARVPARRRSFANSAGILLGRDYGFDLARPGIGLYGGRQGAAMGPIRPVVRPRAEVIQRRIVPAGETVGYGATWVAADTTVAILNVGYADGYLRALGPGGAAYAGDSRCPILGRVSMDLLTVDVTGAGVGEGDWLHLDFDLPVVAARAGVSQYELLTGLGARYQRNWT